jgi:hypothetical protein
MVVGRPRGREAATQGDRELGIPPNDDVHRLSPPIERDDGDMVDFNPDELGGMDVEVSLDAVTTNVNKAGLTLISHSASPR